MDATDSLERMATKVEQTKDQIQTEEATKTSLVMPFIQEVLGYNVFDINEVVPEFIADVGLKKGEKIDYAILHGGEVAILVECKKINQPLNIENASQLFRYFHVTTARIAILTNGQQWQFYTDLDIPNKMDAKPFMELDLLNIDPLLIPQVAKHSKTDFDLDSVLNAAEELKYVSAVKKIMASQLQEIEAEFANFFIGRVYQGRITAKVRQDMTPLIQSGIQQFIRGQVDERLQRALSAGEHQSAASHMAPTSPSKVDPSEPMTPGDDTEQTAAEFAELETTHDEIQGHLIIRAILADMVDISRIKMRDAKTYCAILLDDNNRQPVGRLWFNRSQWYLGTFDEAKKETRNPISGVAEIYDHRHTLRETAARYL